MSGQDKGGPRTGTGHDKGGPRTGRARAGQGQANESLLALKINGKSRARRTGTYISQGREGLDQDCSKQTGAKQI